MHGTWLPDQKASRVSKLLDDVSLVFADQEWKPLLLVLVDNECGALFSQGRRLLDFGAKRIDRTVVPFYLS